MTPGVVLPQPKAPRVQREARKKKKEVERHSAAIRQQEVKPKTIFEMTLKEVQKDGVDGLDSLALLARKVFGDQLPKTPVRTNVPYQQVRVVLSEVIGIRLVYAHDLTLRCAETECGCTQPVLILPHLKAWNDDGEPMPLTGKCDRKWVKQAMMMVDPAKVRLGAIRAQT